MSVSAIPAGSHTINTYLVVKNIEAVVAFCEQTFGATVTHRSVFDGVTRHVTLRVGDSTLMGGEAPDDSWHMPSNVYVYVDDCDAAYARALAAGGTSLMEPATMFYGDRHGGVEDAAGNKWWIATHVEDVASDELQRRHDAEMRRRAECQAAT